MNSPSLNVAPAIPLDRAGTERNKHGDGVGKAKAGICKLKMGKSRQEPIRQAGLDIACGSTQDDLQATIKAMTTELQPADSAVSEATVAADVHPTRDAGIAASY